MRIKKGTVLILTHGEYSDYSYTGPFRVLKSFDQAEIAETFRDAWRAKPHDEWDTRPSEHEFIGWLHQEAYIEDMPKSWDWHIGSYGFEPDIDNEPEQKP